MHPLEQLRDDALREIEAAPDEQALEAARVKYLGKSGSISAWGEQMKTLRRKKSQSLANYSTKFATPSLPRSKRATHNSARKRIGRARQDRHLAAGNTARNRRAAPAHADVGTFYRNFSANGFRTRGRTGH